MIKVGIICPSEIAFRRFAPALRLSSECEYVGVAYATVSEWFEKEDAVTSEEASKVLNSEKEKAEKFAVEYGGKVIEGYENMITSPDIDAVYIPLPPALHYKWAKLALQNGKHVFVEKPSTISYKDTRELTDLAREKKLAIHENYMFIYHSQLQAVNEVIASGEIGEKRLIRIDFGFPMRPAGDFRYNKALGGGAILDNGGYVLKYANYLLGGKGKVDTAKVNYIDEFDVEIFGTGSMSNDCGEMVQFAFGMDCDYRCSIDVWGSKGSLTSKRILTAPAGLETTYTISKNGESNVYSMGADDAFFKSIERFVQCIREDDAREEEYQIINKQEELVEEFREKAGL